MKYIVKLVLIVVLISCKEAPKNQPENIEIVKTEEVIKSYPKELQKVFEAHGGIGKWRKFRTLSFDLPKEKYNEKHTVDLFNRKDRVETPTYAMGFDGKEVWLYDSNESYKGDPKFYHNLMFYFHAMPFVLADNGILYSETEDLEFEGISYPGIKISYEVGVGTSAKDNYYIHYDSNTHEMAWLGYTVTYRSGEVSDNVKWIRYDDWQKINNLLLPKSITWYNYKDKVIKEPRNTVQFENVKLHIESRSSEFYSNQN